MIVPVVRRLASVDACIVTGTITGAVLLLVLGPEVFGIGQVFEVEVGARACDTATVPDAHKHGI